MPGDARAGTTARRSTSSTSSSLRSIRRWPWRTDTRIATIATDEHHKSRASVVARWPFLSDPGRIVHKDLDIQEYTDPDNDPMIPRTLVLKPGLVTHSVYNGHWFWGRREDGTVALITGASGDIGAATAIDIRRISRHLVVRQDNRVLADTHARTDAAATEA